ncbi:MAG TPA: hypothetical protein VK968_02535, partial [Roseimicrobium sp.]|nr:hypothetical protein [Roseimicrobium sp.]
MRRTVICGWLAAIVLAFAVAGCGSKDVPKTSAPESQAPVVVLYCAQDQIFAEPVLKEFRKQTGIEVRAVFDSEAVKTVGLANRLVAEKSRPQCDVFWGNEELRTRQLEVEGVFVPTNG